MTREVWVDNVALILQLIGGFAQFAYLKHRIAKARRTEREA